MKAEDGNVQNSASTSILIWVFVVGFLSTQRFWFPQTSALICASLLLVPIIYGFKHKYSFSVPIISLIAMNDLGGGSYEETPSFLKYIIYIYGMYFGFFFRKYKESPRWIYFMGYNSLVLFNTIFHENQLDEYTLIRDLLTLIILWIVVFAKPTATVSRFGFNLVLIFSSGVLISECVNSLSSFESEIGNYLSYSSSKYIVTFPLFYCLINGLVTPTIVLFPITFWIEFNYNSKMLVLSTISIFILILIKNIFKKDSKSVLVILVVYFSAFAVSDSVIDALSSNRVFASMSKIFSTGSGAFDLEEIDAVRAAERQFFFEQDLYHILFGNGLGTGMLDSTGLFSVALDDPSAFSLIERNRSHFFRLHDSWSWFGFRFGLLPYILVVLLYVRYCFHRSAEVVLLSSTMLLALVNSTFSINGLIVCGILAVSNKVISKQVG